MIGDALKAPVDRCVYTAKGLRHSSAINPSRIILNVRSSEADIVDGTRRRLKSTDLEVNAIATERRLWGKLSWCGPAH